MKEAPYQPYASQFIAFFSFLFLARLTVVTLFMEKESPFVL